MTNPNTGGPKAGRRDLLIKMASSAELSGDEFAGKMLDVLNNSALSMGIAMGDYVGLFTAMAELDKPQSSSEIALKAGLNER